MQHATNAILPEVFPIGKTVEIDEAFIKLTYAVLSETLFSGEVDTALDDTIRDVATIFNVLGKPDVLDLLKAPKWMPRLSKLGWKKPAKKMREQVARLAANRRERIERGEDIPQDFLTLLLTTETEDGRGLSDVQIEDQIMTFIAAGHETTSRALTWLTYLLSSDIKTRDRFETEIDALDMTKPPAEWMNDLPFAMACFNESMRLYPPAPLISRIAIEEDKIVGKNLPKDGTVIVNLWTLHRHKLRWKNPNAFIPDRFMGEEAKKIERFSFLPFGVGHRVCIGQSFALQEAAVMMALVFKNIRLNSIENEPHPWPVMRITTRPEKPMRMQVTRR